MSTNAGINLNQIDLSVLIRNRRSFIIGLIISVALFLFLELNYGWRQGALFLVGLFAGIALYHAAFGFTAGWREVVRTGRGAGLRAQMLMLGITVIVFSLLISQNQVFGTEVVGRIAPLNMAVAFGAFVFGIGMQLGGGCASGTLFTVGGGNFRMFITLIAFIIGSVIGTWHWDSWQDAPGIAPIVLSQSFGPLGGIMVSLIIITMVWFATLVYERNKHGTATIKPRDKSSLLRGPWPLVTGALALVLVQVATLVLAGRPWGVTSGLALWGAKFMGIFSLDVSAWPYWSRTAQALSLDQSVFNNITSVMNLGIILGAFIAASLARKFSPTLKIQSGHIVSAVVGGLLMGYGARLAFGCNIGAYFSGIGSTSMHGWLWFIAAFAGSIIGTKLRPKFGMQ
jgi:uncharacterized membrane protein YedE/YeeE